MEMRRSDSSGTDDDLPPTHSNQVRNNRGSENGKANGTKSIDHLVRSLEQEAYTAVLRAFGAQSDNITWAKERLISDLRKELRVTDEQHREFLAKVSRDESLRQIREWRGCGDAPPHNNTNNTTNNGSSNNLAPNAPPPLVPQARKKLKTGAVSQVPMPPPAPAPAPPPAPPPKPVASKKGAAVSGVPRGKSKGSSDRSSGASQGKRNPEPQDRWVGQTVKVRWPEDNTFYEGYVRDFNKEDGTHTVIYDMGTEKETSERVNFSTIAAEDVQCNGSSDRKKTYQTFKKREKSSSHQINPRGDRKPKLPSVDSLAKQVEELEHNADLIKIERAKRIAKEHEESIKKALLEVGETSEEDDSDGGGGSRPRDGYRSIVANGVDDKDRRQQQH